MKLQPAVKKETGRIFAGCAVMTAIMLAIFAVLHTGILGQVPFGLPVVLSGIIGCLVAVLNFFLMALAVQKVTGITDEGVARKTFTVSYRYRMLLQLAWAIISIAVPFLNGAAGIIPLFFPSILIKIRGISGEDRKAGKTI